jgi:hypothetical protein
VVQFQLLDLIISRECGAVPMDAATRADLIDRMARAPKRVGTERNSIIPGIDGDRRPVAGIVSAGLGRRIKI